MTITPGKLVTWRDRTGKPALGRVLSVHEDGIVPDLPIQLQVKGEAIARIQVQRDKQDVQVFVGVPVSKLTDFVVTAQPVAVEMGTPTDQQMALINQYLPRGARRLQPSEVMSIPFIAADNLLNRGLGKWDVDSLKAMAKLLPGKPALLDHDWDEVEKAWGRIYDAQLLSNQTAPQSAIAQAGNDAINKEIVAKEGFHQVLFQVFASADSWVVDALAHGRMGEVSTGGFQFKDYWCPVCDTSFMNPKCPHYMPYSWRAMDNDPNVAPYYERRGLFDIGEVSLVTVPNLPQAGVIK